MGFLCGFHPGVSNVSVLPWRLTYSEHFVPLPSARRCLPASRLLPSFTEKLGGMCGAFTDGDYRATNTLLNTTTRHAYAQEFDVCAFQESAKKSFRICLFLLACSSFTRFDNRSAREAHSQTATTEQRAPYLTTAPTPQQGMLQRAT